MLPLFNLVRFVIFGTVIAWTLIVLGVAAFLEHILVASDLTRFIPLAIFVASTTLFILIALLIFGAIPSSTLISQTRFELASVTLLGTLWLALGVYTSTEEVADVECDDSDFSYSSATYHAQYHVLQAFSLFNTILLWSFLIFFLFLALRHHFTGRREVWTSKATTYPWLGGAKNAAPQRTRSKSKSQREGQLPLPATTKEKSASKSHGHQHQHKHSHSHQHSHSHSRSQPHPKPREQGPTVVPPNMPPKGKGGHTYVVFIPPPNNTRQQQQVFPQRR
jgi:ABC-type nickel/cobalt efflux system permease component RcnA